MWHDSISRRAVASTLALTLVMQLSGCTSWFVQQQPPAQVLAEQTPEKVRVTRIDGTRLEVYRPQIINDTLVGFKSRPLRGHEATPASIALADIERVEVNAYDGDETVLLVVGVGILVGLVVAAAVAVGNMCPMGC